MTHMTKSRQAFTRTSLKPLPRLGLLGPIGLTAILGLSACATTKAPPMPTPAVSSQPWDTPRTDRLGYAPNVAPFNDSVSPHHAFTNNARATSLWNSSPKSLFGDRRASKTGDILTVVIEIDDEAEINNSVTKNRQANQGFGIGALFGLPEVVNKELPAGASLTPAVDITRDRAENGTGNIRRGEKITLRLAAQVQGVMPNGYLAVTGRQEIMVNSEVRLLRVTGLIRTQDISRLNTITYDKMADARVYYGGQGNITDAVKPQKGQKILNRLLPF